MRTYTYNQEEFLKLTNDSDVIMYNEVSDNDLVEIIDFGFSKIPHYSKHSLRKFNKDSFKVIGEGAFGQVFNYMDKYAIKISTSEPHFSGGDGIANDAYVLSQLEGIVGIPKVYSSISGDIMIYELVQGQTLDNLDPETSICDDFVERVDYSLREVYQRGFLTYDLSSDNMMVNDKGMPMIVDVGLFSKMGDYELQKVSEDIDSVKDFHEYSMAMGVAKHYSNKLKETKNNENNR